MRIKEVKCHVQKMAGSWLTESVVANPMSIYPEYRERRSSWFGGMYAGVIEIILENGVSGFGFMGGGKATSAVAALDEQMRHLVVGKSVFQTELIQDQLYRASIFDGRGGFTQSILSAIDIALWDAKGKILEQPVYNLLGGASRAEIPVYYTGYDPGAPEAFGIRDMKIAVPYGPADGEAGMAKNEAAVARAREVLGDDAFLALDIYMSWDVPYTIRMYERIHKYRIAWLEEPVLPDDYEGYRTIRRSIDTMVAGGEHEYTLAGFRRLMEDGCVDIVQPDIYRAGGPTALRKIAALARAYHVKLVCHGVGSPTYHFLATNGPETTPFAEYVDIYRGATNTWVLTDDPRPHAGVIRLGDAPGFGYDLNRAAFESGCQGVTTIW
ncbi:MAG: enolase C-terminal domain-like protein [Acidobacteriota bacterium]